MTGPITVLAGEVTELLTLWPHLHGALARDTGASMATDKVTGGSDGAFALPINADVHGALFTLDHEVPALAEWAARVVAEPYRARGTDGHLRHFPRWHERMLVTAAGAEADQLAAGLHAILRQVKLALGLRIADRHLGQYCPLHDVPLRELVAPGPEGFIRTASGGGVTVDWVRHDSATCRSCGASWAPGEYLMLGRLMRDADSRRLAARARGAA